MRLAQVAFDAQPRRAVHRHLSPELLAVDLQLVTWAPWAKPHYVSGYPTRCVTERAGEGGILASETRPPLPEWPEAVAATEYAVARLPLRHMAAVMAHYFHPNWPSEAHAQAYVKTVRVLLKRRVPAGIVLRHKRIRPPGLRAFPDDLDRARWSLKAVLML